MANAAGTLSRVLGSSARYVVTPIKKSDAGPYTAQRQSQDGQENGAAFLLLLEGLLAHCLV